MQQILEARSFLYLTFRTALLSYHFDQKFDTTANNARFKLDGANNFLSVLFSPREKTPFFSTLAKMAPAQKVFFAFLVSFLFNHVCFAYVKMDLGREQWTVSNDDGSIQVNTQTAHFQKF